MRYRPKMSFLSIEGSPVGRKNHRRLPLFCLDDGVRLTPTATLLEHLLLTQGFMSPSKAVSLIAGDRKIVILRGQFWATHSSVAVGLNAYKDLTTSVYSPTIFGTTACITSARELIPYPEGEKLSIRLRES